MKRILQRKKENESEKTQQNEIEKIIENTSNTIQQNEIKKIIDSTLKNIRTPKSNKNYQYQYYKKDYILTKTELIFYKQLKILTDNANLILLTQIPVYSLIKTKNTIYKTVNFNKIKAKTIDFVIATPNLKPILCIELDDYTHLNPERIERDIFINKLFEELQIELLRIPVNSNYDLTEIKKHINKI